MEKQLTERIAILVEPYFKFQVKQKACSKKTTITKVVRTLLEKWLKEK